jgi:hypothetical protein
LVGVPPLDDPDELEDDEEPQAERTAPSTLADIPIMLPRRRNSRRPMCPETNSSM